MEKQKRQLRSKKIDWRKACPLGKEIPISKKEDDCPGYWMGAVKMEKYKDMFGVGDENIQYIGEPIGIEKGDAECFLEYYLEKHFRPEIIYNRLRVDYLWNNEFYAYYDGFQEYGVDNYYTYEIMGWLLEDIEDTIELLRTDYDNKELASIKKEFSCYYMIDYKNMSQNNYDTPEKRDMLVQENIEVVIDFYQRFVEAMWKIMDENPEGNCISVTGP